MYFEKSTFFIMEIDSWDQQLHFCMLDTVSWQNTKKKIKLKNLFFFQVILVYPSSCCSTAEKSESTTASTATATSKATTPDLIHYWSFDDSSLNDSIGGKKLQININGAPALDRNWNANSALEFTAGYAYAPTGVYFDPANGGSTAMAWVKFKTLTNWQRIFDFGNQADTNIRDHIYISIKNSKVAISVANDGTRINGEGNTQVTANTWIHVALSIDTVELNATVYVNGIRDGSWELPATNSYRATNRTLCGVGKSAYSNNPLFSGVIDEFKIFDRALKAQEIMFLAS